MRHPNSRRPILWRTLRWVLSGATVAALLAGGIAPAANGPPHDAPRVVAAPAGPGLAGGQPPAGATRTVFSW